MELATYTERAFDLNDIKNCQKRANSLVDFITEASYCH